LRKFFSPRGPRIPSAVQAAVRKISATLPASLRLLPDFIIIGAQKCGTTSLYNYLIEHPWVAPSAVKEVHFFDLAFARGVTWYRRQFPSLLKKCYARTVLRQDLVTGEASPYYIFHPHAPRRIRMTLPNVKLIVLLRNPVDRAFSHYQHSVRSGNEPLSFEEALEKECERLDGELEKMLANEHYRSMPHQAYSYLLRGIYVDQLKTWLGIFPAAQMLILSSEDFYASPAATYRQTLEFLGLPTYELREYRKYDHGGYRAKMDSATRRWLVEYFRPHNRRLYDFLDRRFDWDG
jgi:hypothetical protein